MDQQIITPKLYAHRVTNRPEMLGGETGLHDGSNTFTAHSFVVLSAGNIASVATAGTSTCGLCLDASYAADIINPPTQFNGDRHWPVALPGQRFAVNITDGSGHIGQANSAPQTSAVAVGTQYGVYKLSGGQHLLNSADTTNLFFRLVEIPSQWQGTFQDANTYNPVVIVEVVSAAIQQI